MDQNYSFCKGNDFVIASKESNKKVTHYFFGWVQIVLILCLLLVEPCYHLE